jgi:hypothetical protein
VKIGEVEMVTRLIWKLAAAFGIALVLMITTMGGGFLFLAGADAQQDVQFSGMVSQTQFSQMFAQVQTENRREHDIILTAVAANSEKTKTNSNQIAKVDSKVSKILGIVELLIDKIKDDDDD